VWIEYELESNVTELDPARRTSRGDALVLVGRAITERVMETPAAIV
jgi:hypothetical protein